MPTIEELETRIIQLEKDVADIKTQLTLLILTRQSIMSSAEILLQQHFCMDNFDRDREGRIDTLYAKENERFYFHERI